MDQRDFDNTMGYLAHEATRNAQGELAQRQREAAIQHNLGRHNAVVENWTLAFFHMTEALRLNPDLPEAAAAFNVIGMCHQVRDEFALAEQAYDNAIARSSDPIHQFERARMRRIRGNHQGAVDDFDAAIAKGHRLLEAKFLRALSLQRLRQWQAAIAGYKEVIALGPPPPFAPVAWASLGECQQELGESDEALVSLNQAMKLDPKLPPPLITRAEIWISRDDTKGALEDLNEAKALIAATVLLKPPARDVQSLCARLATAYEKVGEMKLAVAVYTMVIEASPSSQFKLQRGKCLQQLKDWGQAILDYADVVQDQPNNWAAWGCMGECQMNTGDMDNALANLSEALRLNPHSAVAYFFRSGVWMHQGNLERALADAHQAVWRDSKFAAAYMRRCDVYMRLGQVSEALQDATDAIRLDSQMAAAYAFRAKLHMADRSYAEALADLEMLVRLQEPTDENLYDTARCCYYQDQLPRALSLISSLVSRASCAENPQALILRVRILLKMGEHERSIEDLDTVIRLHQQSGNRQKLSEAHHLRGVVYADRDDFDAALNAFAEALRLNPHSANTFRARGIVHRSMGRHEEALADFNQSILLNPIDLDAYTLRAQLHKDMGRVEEAIQDVKHVISMLGDWCLSLAYAYRIRAECYMLKEDWKRALRDLNLVIAHPVPGGDMAMAHRDRAEVYDALDDEEAADQDRRVAEQLSRGWIPRLFGEWIDTDVDSSSN